MERLWINNFIRHFISLSNTLTLFYMIKNLRWAFLGIKPTTKLNRLVWDWYFRIHLTNTTFFKHKNYLFLIALILLALCIKNGKGEMGDLVIDEQKRIGSRDRRRSRLDCVRERPTFGHGARSKQTQHLGHVAHHARLHDRFELCHSRIHFPKTVHHLGWVKVFVQTQVTPLFLHSHSSMRQITDTRLGAKADSSY